MKIQESRIKDTRQDRAECWAAKEANHMLSETSSPGITLELQDKR